MKCKNCNNNTYYILQNDYIKCKKCAKKYSLKKLQTDRKIIKAFCDNKNALEVSKELEVNYRTIKNRYDEYRHKIALFLEEEYNSSIKDYSEYEEFYYFKQRDKNKKKKNLYTAINIMGFYSSEKVYTLLMPKLTTSMFEEDKGFDAYMNWYKIHSQNAYQTNLKKFWEFLEENLKKYKGVDEDNFFYYLKECEFRFNYTKEEQLKILIEDIKV